MKHRLPTMVVVFTLGLVAMAACGGKAAPEGPTTDDADRAAEYRAREKARMDSLRAAEEARADSLRVARERERETAAALEVIGEMIHFAYDRAQLTPEAEATLQRKLAVLRANPDLRIRIEGHADERGSIEYNRALGQLRAEAARDFLTGYGISINRINLVSFGEDRPLVDASNEEAWAMNRRDEFTVLSGGDSLRLPSGL